MSDLRRPTNPYGSSAMGSPFAVSVTRRQCFKCNTYQPQAGGKYLGPNRAWRCAACAPVKVPA